ncbi:hypothetical protein [Natronocalculus amylovorans]|uniref:Domain of unknown function domain-containing protein n=1 Tax=Natronocalculus amylovorans TaxID=2917812 RepID=A0AAE3K8Q9_9EURY|nr:hypothetical protein [Natronocalculus amylovorans]MCL9817572.1 hypothetical protein [Natronocalculus amylovorans]NUE02403.1 hypothetical protein [Halorubraceae archaeon YAN]
MNGEERDRGILSAADRAYLRGEKTFTHEQSKRNAEARIRNRVREATIDFMLLARFLKQKDREQIFQKHLDDPAFHNGVRAALSFYYLGCKEAGLEFEHVLSPAIRKAEEIYAVNRLGKTATVDLTFVVDVDHRQSTDDVADRLKTGEPVSPPALFSLMVDGHDVIEQVDTFRIRLGVDTGYLDEAEFVASLADHLDATAVDSDDQYAVIRR